MKAERFCIYQGATELVRYLMGYLQEEDLPLALLNGVIARGRSPSRVDKHAVVEDSEIFPLGRYRSVFSNPISVEFVRGSGSLGGIAQEL